MGVAALGFDANLWALKYYSGASSAEMYAEFVPPEAFTFPIVVAWLSADGKLGSKNNTAEALGVSPA